MRLMSYNILRGGAAFFGGTGRLNSILELIRTCAPDILALQEANGFEDPALVQMVSRTLSLPHAALATGALYSDGDRYHVAVFSRYPISDVYRFPSCRFQSAAMSMRLETPLGRILLWNLHLHATSEIRRLAELNCVLEHLDPAEDHLLVGDLNALSRRDAYPDPDGEFDLRFDVTDRLNHVLVDLGAPAPGATAWTHPSRLPADHHHKIARRIDYAFAASGLAGQVIATKVIRSPLAHRASDHFPLVVDFAGPERPDP